MASLFKCRHFSTDELFGSWMFALATFPLVPYCLVSIRSYVFLLLHFIISFACTSSPRRIICQSSHSNHLHLKFFFFSVYFLFFAIYFFFVFISLAELPGERISTTKSGEPRQPLSSNLLKSQMMQISGCTTVKTFLFALVDLRWS